jgi:hypothetical protein
MIMGEGNGRAEPLALGKLGAAGPLRSGEADVQGEVSEPQV